MRLIEAGCSARTRPANAPNTITAQTATQYFDRIIIATLPRFIGRLELDRKLEFGALTREFRQVQRRAWNIDVASADLHIPRRGDEHFGIELHKKGRPHVNRIAREGVEPSAVIVPQIPNLGADEHRRHDAVSERAGHSAL